MGREFELNIGQSRATLKLSEVVIGPEKGHLEHIHVLRSCSLAMGQPKLLSCSTSSGSPILPWPHDKGSCCWLLARYRQVEISCPFIWNQPVVLVFAVILQGWIPDPHEVVQGHACGYDG